MYKELLGIGKKIEMNLKDMQDMEFTVQEGELFMLQTRNGKRSPLAGLKIAVALAEEGVITEKEALERTSMIEYRIASSNRRWSMRADCLGSGHPRP